MLELNPALTAGFFFAQALDAQVLDTHLEFQCGWPEPRVLPMTLASATVCVMKNFVALAVLTSLSFAKVYAQDVDEQPYSLVRLQGGWWAGCDAPAVEFFIRGNEYSGDFEGVFEVTLSGDVLVFAEGFAEGHSTEVTHQPLEFRILELTDAQLVLRPLAGDPAGDDWRLRSCDDEA